MKQPSAGTGRYVPTTAVVVFAALYVAGLSLFVGGPGQFISPGGPMNYDLGGAMFIVFFLALGLPLSFWHGRSAGADQSLP